MMAVASRMLTVFIALSLTALAPGTTRSVAPDGGWSESRFQTGCEPGPSHPAPWPDPLETHAPPTEPAETVQLSVDVGGRAGAQTLLGSGFNLEHALWSCPEFRGMFRSQLLDVFRPAVGRLDSGL